MARAGNTLPPWKQQVIKLQESFRQTLGDRKYDHFTDTDLASLKKELGYAILGDPPHNGGYGTVETSLIEEVFRFIREVNKGAKNYYISFVFVVCCVGESQCLRPVFKVNCCGEVDCDKILGFVDETPRLYKSWKHYLETNQLPQCIMGYPREGSYWIRSGVNRRFQLKYRYSPAHNIGHQFHSCLATCSPAVGAVASGICIASMFDVPISTALLAVADVASVASCNVVNTYLGVATLLDRRQHRQSISVADPKVRTCYLNVAAGVTWAVSSLGLLRLNDMAMSGQSMTLETRRVVLGVAIVAVLASGGRMLNCLWDVRRKERDGEKATEEEGNLMASAYLFYNTVSSAQRARNLVNNMSSPKNWFQQIYSLFRIS